MTTKIEFYRVKRYRRTDMMIKNKKLQSAVKKISRVNTLTPTIKKALESIGFTFTEVKSPEV